MGNTSGIKAGRAYVALGTDDSKMVAGLKRAQQRLRAFGAGLKSVGMGLGMAGAAVLAPLGVAWLLVARRVVRPAPWRA